MIRSIAIAIALLVTAPAFAAEQAGPHLHAPVLSQAASTDTAKPKPRRKAPKPSTDDYLVVTLVDAQITSY